MISLWQSILIFSTLVIPQPVQAEPAPSTQQWNDTSVVSVGNPVTQTTISVQTQIGRGRLLASKQKKTQELSVTQSQRRSNPANLASSCVNYAHAVVGIKQPIGWARNQPINSKEPAVKSIVVTTESSVGTNSGHLAVVTEVKPDGIVVSEANYVRGKITHGRFIAFNSGKIRGYFQVQNPKPD